MDSDVIGNDIWTKVLSMLEDVANTPKRSWKSITVKVII